MKVIGEIDFNRDDDKEEFGTEDKVVRLYRFTEEGERKVGLSFDLGRKDDDCLNLFFNLSALLVAIASAEEE